MSRPSKELLEDFIKSSEFSQFLKHLKRDTYLTLASAIELWRLKPFKTPRERRDFVAARLVELSRRTCLDFSDPDYVRIARSSCGNELRLLSATLPVLKMPDCIGHEPFFSCSATNPPDDREIKDISRRLRSRFVGSGEIQWVRVFGYPEGFRNYGDHVEGLRKKPKLSGKYTDAALAFSAGALHPYYNNAKEQQKIEVQTRDLVEIFSDDSFLCSPNAVLLCSDIRRRIAKSRRIEHWALNPVSRAFSLHRGLDMMHAQLPQTRCYEEVGDLPNSSNRDLRILFAGAAHFGTLQRFFRFHNVARREIWLEIW